MAEKAKLKLTEKNTPRLNIGGMQFKLLHDFDRYSNGKLLMRMYDCEREIVETTKPKDDPERVVGVVGCAIGGILFVQVGKRLWALESVMDLYSAVVEAEKTQYHGGHNGKASQEKK